jgi:type II secretory pathway component GspD/PulD (secretin)
MIAGSCVSAQAAPGASRRGGAEEGPGTRAPAAWEYKAMAHSQVEALAAKEAQDRLSDGLNKLGADGWELVTVEPSSPSTSPLFLFKRPAAGSRRAQRENPAQQAEPQVKDFRVYRLRYADATELAQTLLKLLQGGDGQALRLVGDQRTNSLLGAGSPQQQAQVEALINELDRPVEGKTEPKRK